MDYKELGKTKEKIPVLGMGTWKLGADPGGEVAAMKAGIKAGMTFIDTAEMYGTEGIVGQVLKDEKDIFLATKVSPDHFHYDDVIKACNQSLKRLGVKTIDLYQLHWPNTGIPIKETMSAMEQLASDGKIRYIGVSNFSVKEMNDAQASMKRNEIVSNQVEYNMLSREIEQELMDHCERESITVIAYSPLARGALLGKKYPKLQELLEETGKRYSKTAAQVALNWLIRSKPVVAIPKASTAEHTLENAGAAGFKLSEKDAKQISSFLGAYM